MDEKLKTLTDQKQDIVSSAAEIVIFSREDNEMANNILVGIKEIQKQAKEVFDPMVSKAHAAHKEATKVRKLFLDPLSKAETKVKIKIGEYLQRKEKERRDKEALLQQQAKEEGLSVKVTLDDEEKIEGQSVRYQWFVESVDASKLPDEYKMPNMPLLESIARSGKEKANIDGVKFNKKPIVVSRRA